MTYFIALKLRLEYYFFLLNNNGYKPPQDLNHKLRFVTSTSVTKLVIYLGD